MYRKVEDFIAAYEYESGATLKLLNALTDESLSHAVGEGHRTLGRMAWHIAVTIPEMGSAVGFEIAGPDKDSPVPETAAQIAEAYKQASESLLNEVRTKWDDATLEVTDDLYGETWARGKTLAVVLNHEIHHRGQLTVLMRQSGLKVPGIYGPSKEEWVNYGAPEPAV
jgi:uncharacterized damage-inducible protein DinB